MEKEYTFPDARRCGLALAKPHVQAHNQSGSFSLICAGKDLPILIVNKTESWTPQPAGKLLLHQPVKVRRSLGTSYDVRSCPPAPRSNNRSFYRSTAIRLKPICRRDRCRCSKRTHAGQTERTQPVNRAWVFFENQLGQSKRQRPAHLRSQGRRIMVYHDLSMFYHAFSAHPRQRHRGETSLSGDSLISIPPA